MQLSNEEMIKIEGGGIKFTIAGAIIGGIITFVIGLVDGLIHPKSCS